MRGLVSNLLAGIREIGRENLGIWRRSTQAYARSCCSVAVVSWLVDGGRKNGKIT